MITVYLNDYPYQIQNNQSLQAFLLAQNHSPLHFAVAINNQCIPRALHSTRCLCEGDRIDIIVPMQGG